MLELREAEAAYGKAHALHRVSLAVRPGHVTALVGRNGAGKSTTLKALMGQMRLRGGSRWLDGRDVSDLSPEQLSRQGVAFVPEDRQIFSGLSTDENLQLAALSHAAGPWTLERIHGLFPQLHERRRAQGTSLSGGEQQMLAIGRALMTNPRLVILDEATEGLAPVIRQDIWAAIRRLKHEGQSILVVDKTMAELLPVADRCVVLERGRTVWSGPPDALTREMQDRYLGV